MLEFDMFPKKIVLFLFGRPGSGKTGLAHTLSKDLQFTSFSVGESLRHLARTHNGPEARRAEQILLTASYAPNDLVFTMLSQQGVMTSKLVFDGYPISCEQLKDLPGWLKSVGFGSAILAGFWLDVPIALALQRVRERKYCAQCGLACVSGSNQCRACNGECNARIDDQFNHQRRRMQMFEINVTKAIEIFSISYPLFRIDASDDADNVAKRIVQHVRTLTGSVSSVLEHST